MIETELVSDYFSRVLTISNQMKKNGDKLENVTIMEKILRSLDPKFENIITVIEETKNLRAMTIEQLLGFLQAREEKKKKMQNFNEQFFKAQLQEKEENFGNRRGCGKGRGQGRSRGRRGGRRYFNNNYKNKDIREFEKRSWKR
ncbi:hypothetical protein PanWU01x14_312190 [Parasponia andersonii]|uniref:Uncharacterized protein n=1 Tax=Parasponia andersonii TaxID=3476 RepID=A0A2P5APN7_PARAD|nr:hypothetical protein PanWU01x14_312190 [Parasponia andersonii]